MRKDDPEDLKEDLKRPADVRDTNREPRLMIQRCHYCGREVREDWTPAQSDQELLCARCLEMVRDPDTLWR